MLGSPWELASLTVPVYDPKDRCMIGTTIGCFRILRVLGEGGMGLVYEAIDESIDRRVAIKVLKPEHSRNKALVTRFVNEARASNRVPHPAIVPVTSLGQLGDDTHYLVMEYLDGRLLSTRIAQMPSGLPVAEAIRYARFLASVLAAAHGCGVIHRDLKPGNIMLVTDPDTVGQLRVKLMDLGIAKLQWTFVGGDNFDAVATRLATQAGAQMGTPAYMAPEQCQDPKSVTEHADTYALGIILFEMLTGKRPFDGASSYEIMNRQVEEQPPALADVVPGLPLELVQLVQQMLRKAPTERPSMGEVHAVLLGLEASAGQHGAQGSPLPVPSRVLASLWLLLAFGFGLTGGGAVATYFAARGLRPPPLAESSALQVPAAPPAQTAAQPSTQPRKDGLTDGSTRVPAQQPQSAGAETVDLSDSAQTEEERRRAFRNR